jgi:hypothetical protein
MQEPTRESTIRHRVTELGETAQRLLRVTKDTGREAGTVMGPHRGSKSAIHDAPGPLGSPLAEGGVRARHHAQSRRREPPVDHVEARHLTAGVSFWVNSACFAPTARTRGSQRSS